MSDGFIGAVLGIAAGLLWMAPAWYYGRASGIKYATDRAPKPALKPNPNWNRPLRSCPTRLMDGRNEIRCWLNEGHEGDCK